jgi:hypothetical protein
VPHVAVVGALLQASSKEPRSHHPTQTANQASTSATMNATYNDLPSIPCSIGLVQSERSQAGDESKTLQQIPIAILHGSFSRHLDLLSKFLGGVESRGRPAIGPESIMRRAVAAYRDVHFGALDCATRGGQT